MIELQGCDFRPLEVFHYLWRWTDPRYNVLPLSSLAHIHLLKEEKSKELWEHEYVYFNELSRYAFTDTPEPINSALFAWIQHIDISQEQLEKVQVHLRLLQPQEDEDQEVVVIWEPEAAVTAPGLSCGPIGMTFAIQVLMTQAFSLFQRSGFCFTIMKSN